MTKLNFLLVAATINVTFLWMSIDVVRAGPAADGQAWTHKDAASNGSPSKEGRSNVISPRMDFDQWTPLGRGDPLKNDPTFDYLPPVLDKVHYWKPSPSAAAVNRAAHYPSTIAPSSAHAVHYNRRFFLTDFSKKEPAAPAYVQYTHKRPQLQPAVPALVTVGPAGYHYPRPKTPLPMLTPPPYQRPVPSTTVEPMDMTPFLLDTGNSAAESKQPPAVRAPPPTKLQSSAAAVAAAAATASASAEVRPALPHSVIKVLLDAEVDRTTMTTATMTTATMTAAAMTSRTTTMTTPTARTTAVTTAPAAVAAGPVFAAPQQKQATADRPPMFLIIQGHSKVKTYGLASKPDDLQSAAQSAAQDHNHLGNGSDEPSRRKRNGPLR